MAKQKTKKAQVGTTIKPTADSTAYFKGEEKIYNQLSNSEKGDNEVSKFNKSFFRNKASEAASNQLRQFHKGVKGYDANGYPIVRNVSNKPTAGRDKPLPSSDGILSTIKNWFE